MAVIRLHKGDYRIIRPVAIKLFQYWNGKKDNNYYQTLSGICSEYAVIKYLNECLCATPQIPFNDEYINGKDGGIDFRFPADMSWDVKSSSKPYLDPEFALKTKAQVICGVQKQKCSLYKILGFAPRQKLEYLDRITEEHFLPIDSLVRLFPSHLKLDQSKNPMFRRYKSEVQHIGSFARNAIMDLRLKQTIRTRA